MKKLLLLLCCAGAGYAAALGVGMIGAKGNGTSVSPSHAYLDPNGDSSTAWDVENGPANYDDINDETRPPTAPDTTQYANRVELYTAATGDDVYEMEAAPSGATTTSIVVYAYGYVWPGAAISVDLYIAGSWEGAVALGYTDYVAAWKSATFSGSWSEAQVNAMQVKLSKTAGASTYTRVYELTAYITYTD